LAGGADENKTVVIFELLVYIITEKFAFFIHFIFSQKTNKSAQSFRKQLKKTPKAQSSRLRFFILP
jgi:hypothetical protein